MATIKNGPRKGKRCNAGQLRGDPDPDGRHRCLGHSQRADALTIKALSAKVGRAAGGAGGRPVVDPHHKQKPRSLGSAAADPHADPEPICIPQLVNFAECRLLLREVGAKLASRALGATEGNALRGVAESAGRLLQLELSTPPPAEESTALQAVEELATAHEKIAALEAELRTRSSSRPGSMGQPQGPSGAATGEPSPQWDGSPAPTTRTPSE